METSAVLHAFLMPFLLPSFNTKGDYLSHSLDSHLTYIADKIETAVYFLSSFIRFDTSANP